jgi:small subunit ribosomal protein S18
MDQRKEEIVESTGPEVDTNIDQGFDKMPRRFQRRRPRQVVPDYVDWKDVDFLKRFIPERGKIMPRRISGVSAKDQRRIAKAIKRARTMALLPFVAD